MTLQAMEVTDFDAVETAIAGVEARVVELARQGTGFLSPQESLREPRIRSRMLDRPHEVARWEVTSAEQEGNPIKIARAQAEAGRLLATTPGTNVAAISRSQLKKAIVYWRSAMSVWTREQHARKWGALMHNIGVAEEGLGLAGKGDLRRYRAALTKLDAALDALEPEVNPWSYAAVLAPRLRVAALLA